MNAFAESGIAAAQKRIAKVLEELKAAVRCDVGDPFVWHHIGEAMQQAKFAEGALRDALVIEEMATVDTQRPAGGE